MAAAMDTGVRNAELAQALGVEVRSTSVYGSAGRPSVNPPSGAPSAHVVPPETVEAAMGPAEEETQAGVAEDTQVGAPVEAGEREAVTNESGSETEDEDGEAGPGAVAAQAAAAEEVAAAEVEVDPHAW